MSIVEKKKRAYEAQKPKLLKIEEFLEMCREDPSLYQSVHGKLLKQFGEPEFIDPETRENANLIHGVRPLPRYPAFADFYGMEEVIESVASFLRHADQNLEERRQVLYLKGPVGSAKSSIAEKLKALFSSEGICIPVLVYLPDGEEDEQMVIPCNCHPFMVFDREDVDEVSEEYSIPKSAFDRRLTKHPLFVKYWDESEGNLDHFRVELVRPSEVKQIAITKTEPGDENSQDITTYTGNVNLSKLGIHAQNDPEAYAYDGALSTANQGMLECVEVFKSPPKVLLPLLTATQEGTYKPSEGFGAIPFDGLILAHSNESEWESFTKNPDNEAFIDRFEVVDCPYNLRVSEEVKILKKIISNSEISKAPVAPYSFEVMAQLAVLTRLVVPENSPVELKMRVYDGEDMQGEEGHKPYSEYLREARGKNEGKFGLSTRFGFKTMSHAFNYDSQELGVNPVHVISVLEKRLDKVLNSKVREAAQNYLKEFIIPNYMKVLEVHIRQSFTKTNEEACQNAFENYYHMAEHWIKGESTNHLISGVELSTDALNKALAEMEVGLGVPDIKLYRKEFCDLYLRHLAANQSVPPRWNSNGVFSKVIESYMLSGMEKVLPSISKMMSEPENMQEDQLEYLKNMEELGYSKRQAQIVSLWYIHKKQTAQV